MKKNSKTTISQTNGSLYTIVFILCLSLVTGVLLSSSSYILLPIKQKAKQFDQDKQMLMSAQILDNQGYFQVFKDQKFSPASYDKKTALLSPTSKASKITSDELLSFSNSCVRPFLTDLKGNIYSLEEQQTDLQSFLEANESKSSNQKKFFLFYGIVNNQPEAIKMSNTSLAKNTSQLYAITIPVSGFGLWGPLYGYLSLKNDGDTVLGAAWYKHGETPGLGANITDNNWLSQFHGKKVFSKSAKNSDISQAQLGLKIIKGSVISTFGDSPEALSSIDGISGATLTCNGVTEAYVTSLAPYRNLLLNLNKKNTGK